MRPSLLLIAISALVLVPACATPGRTSRDTGRSTADTGRGTDGGMPTPDMGTGHDAGPGAPDMGTVPTDDAGHDGGAIVRPDAFVPDTGTDAFVVPVDTGCTSDTQCSNGIGCDGMERCVAGACLPPLAPLSCDDGLACTTDSCAEPGTCNHTSTCAGGAACMASGCASSCAESPCRLLSPQCGCTTGQACYPQGATRVCAAVGTGTVGAACTSSSSCAATYACLNIAASGTPVNQCVKMCATDTECGGGLCIYDLDNGTGGAVPGLHLCSHPCNAATGAGCGAGSVCAIFGETAGAMRNFTDCTAPTTGGGEDTGCTSGADCSPERVCIDTGDGLANACHHWCNVANNAGCTGGRTCLGFTTPVTVNGITYGVCSF